MKKSIITLAFILALLTACSKKENSPNSPEKETATVQTEKVQTEKVQTINIIENITESDLETAPIELFNQIVLAYDSMKLIETDDLLHKGVIADFSYFTNLYYSSDLKPRILKYVVAPNWLLHTLTCYFINNTNYFIKYEDYEYNFDKEDSEKTEEKIWLIVNNEPFDVADDGLRAFSGNADAIKFINGILDMVLDRNGAVIPDKHTENGFTVTRDGRLVDYSGHDNSVVIPSQVGGIPVTAIGYDEVFNGKGLTQVTIPDSIIMIAVDEFYGNPLSVITIGADVTVGEPKGNVGDPPFYSFDSDFDLFYNANGQKAGTYVTDNGTWSMK